eukprot:10426366-Prorocentrum_lima.AAC.1
MEGNCYKKLCLVPFQGEKVSIVSSVKVKEQQGGNDVLDPLESSFAHVSFKQVEEQQEGND